ncbi:MAG: DUF5916 domain-containing protein [Lysobacteraceae bacterium]
MYRHFLSTCLSLALASMACTAVAQDSQAPLIIPRAATPPNLDDYVSGVPADAGVDVYDFKQNTPGDGEPATVETHSYLSFDDSHLYVVTVCKDDPSQVRARVVRRDTIFGDDAILLYLDTFDDNQRAFIFGVNPYGAQLDGKVTEGQGTDFNYDTQWVSDGKLTADGYVSIMKIPFKSLRFNRGSAQKWGIAIQRLVPRLNEFSYWPYVTQRKDSFIPQFAEARLEEEISPGRNISIIPHATFRTTRLLEDDSNGNPRIGSNSKFDAGVDAKFVIRDSLAVDLTVNPDFGEVESDEPQIIVNKRFEVQFPEKRPFFLENSGFFSTPNTLFFSRRIVDPKYGARVTGRLGRWAVGGLLINDEAAGASLFGPSVDKTGNIGVARVQRDFGTQSNVGVLVADRKVDDHSNRVLSLDTRIKINDNWALTAQAVQSDTGNPGSSQDSTGHLYYLDIARGGRNFTYDGSYSDISEDFNTELGFVPRTNIRQLWQSASYLWKYPDAKWLVSAGPSVSYERNWDQNGDLADWTANAGFVVNGSRYTSFEGHWIESYEKFLGIGFRKQNYSLSASSEWLSWLTGSVSYSAGDSINFFPNPSLQPFLADSRQFAFDFTLSPTSQFRVTQSFIWQDLRTKGAIAGHGADDSIFQNTLSRTKFNYQFSRFLSAHIIFDYSDLQTDTSLFAFDRSKRLTSDVLVSYVLSPGTALYVGYTDQQQNLRLIGSPRILQLTDNLDLHTGKQLFVKYSRLFNY